MKALFVMQYPGYLRYMDSTIRMLLGQGWSIEIAFDNPGKQAEGLRGIKDLEQLGDQLTVRRERVAMRQDIWMNFADLLRAITDYVRYLDPRFASADYLRRRMGDLLPPGARWLTSVPMLPRPVVGCLLRLLKGVERAIPSAALTAEYLKSVNPDVLVITPLVNPVSRQTDLVKSAQALGIPTALTVASWDHLTSKGLIRVKPDMIFVWNPIQKMEAIDLHRISSDRIVVTGAQPFDKWFGRVPTISRDMFCARVGLPPDRPYILFVGSTASISTPDAEVQFVQKWVDALRSSSDEALREASILIRPHPYNCTQWADVGFPGQQNIAIYPRAGANPVDEGDRADYFNSMFFSSGIVGINTSAMVEATILDRPVMTILSDEFANTQGGTLHFHYLLPENGGFLQVARSLEEHTRQLASVLNDPETHALQIRSFVNNFVRPNGRDVAATPQVVEGIMRLAAGGRRAPATVPVYLLPVTMLSYLLTPFIPKRRKVKRVGPRPLKA